MSPGEGSLQVSLQIFTYTPLKILSAHSSLKYSSVKNVNEQLWQKLFTFKPNSVVILCSEAKCVAGYKNPYTTCGEAAPLCLQSASKSYLQFKHSAFTPHKRN